jgi:heme-degrading monooxygenase HmoA
MIAKWIRCDVPENKRQAFSEAQAGWSELASVPGFIAQIGGWSSTHPRQACILAFWRDLAAYEAFTSKQHDEIVARLRQQTTYSRIDIKIIDAAVFNESDLENEQFEFDGCEFELQSAWQVQSRI